jgi:hypothetical protein
MKYYLPLLLLLTASACSTVRTLPVQDSTRVEVRYETKTVHDTAYVELPVIVEKVVTLDTASVLENKYAKSAASVSGGVLAHSLETKPVREPVSVEKQIVYRDSLVYRDKVQTVTVEVEKKLTWWQSFKMKLGVVTLVSLVIVVIYSIFLIINHFKS